MSQEPYLPFNIRTAIAVTLGRIAERKAAVVADRIERILQLLLSGPIPGHYAAPERQLSRLYLAWLRQRQKEVVDESELELTPVHLEGTTAEITTNREDHLWQLHLAVAKARLAMGSKLQNEAYDFGSDQRGFVREALFKKIDK